MVSIFLQYNSDWDPNNGNDDIGKIEIARIIVVSNSSDDNDIDIGMEMLVTGLSGRTDTQVPLLVPRSQSQPYWPALGGKGWRRGQRGDMEE